MKRKKEKSFSELFLEVFAHRFQRLFCIVSLARSLTINEQIFRSLSSCLGDFQFVPIHVLTDGRRQENTFFCSQISFFSSHTPEHTMSVNIHTVLGSRECDPANEMKLLKKIELHPVNVDRITLLLSSRERLSVG